MALLPLVDSPPWVLDGPGGKAGAWLFCACLVFVLWAPVRAFSLHWQSLCFLKVALHEHFYNAVLVAIVSCLLWQRLPVKGFHACCFTTLWHGMASWFRFNRGC